jgi:hypothetical protein
MSASLTAWPRPRPLLSARGILKLLIPIAALACAADLRAQNKACALATPGELTAALGATVSSLKPQEMTGTTQICLGSTSNAKVLLRVTQKSSDEGAEDAKSNGETERKGMEIMKKMGAQVDVKTFGPVTCSTITPPATMPESGYNTTCSYSQKTGVAAIEITAKTQKDAVPIDKLRPLAEKMADRF